MASREITPLRREARTELRVWPAAVVLVVVYLIAADWRDDPAPRAPEAMTDAPPPLGAWQFKEGDL